MQHHVETWVTEAHFDWMAAHGINMVRVPLGWWNVLDFSELPEVGVGPSWVAMPPAAEVSMRALICCSWPWGTPTTSLLVPLLRMGAPESIVGA